MTEAFEKKKRKEKGCGQILMIDWLNEWMIDNDFWHQLTGIGETDSLNIQSRRD